MKKIKNLNSNLTFEQYTMEKMPLKKVFKNDIKIMNIFLIFFLLLGSIFYFIFGWGSLIFCLGLWLLVTINLFINDISINKKTPKYIEVNIMDIKVILNNRQNFSILFSDIISINRQYYVSKSGVRWSNYYEFITENRTYKLPFSNMTYDEKFKITIKEHIKLLNERGLKKQRKRIKNYSEKDRLKLLYGSKKIRVFPEKSIIKVRYKSYKIKELKTIAIVAALKKFFEEIENAS